jgi:hypothetical protein
MEKVNFNELLNEMLLKLSDRDQDILKKRFHLTNDLEKKATLKAIGDFYNITRERVRQLERDAINKLVELKKEQQFADQLNTLESELLGYLKSKGGVVREDHLLEDFVNGNYTTDKFHSNAFLFVFDKLVDGVNQVNGHEDFHKSWSLKELSLDNVSGLVQAIVSKLDGEKKLHESKDILAVADALLSDELKSELTSFENSGELNAYLENYLHASNKIDKNILDKWGLVAWETVRPKKLADKIKLIFDKSGEPLHFRDLAQNINTANFDHKNICAATVHNELIANDEYVLIGRGIYAKKDWGYSAGTVGDIIERLLKEHNAPMTKDEIYNQVLEQRKVNKSTIYLTLINKEKFEKVDGGKFMLK